jgi:IMP dehydrogenase
MIEDAAALTFDDVLIEPQYSEVKSRSHVDTSSILVPGINLRVPVLSANMDSVTGLAMAQAMDSIGAIGILHRFMTTDEQVKLINEFKMQGGGFIGSAIGVKDDCARRAHACVEAGSDVIVLDVAHGHTKVVGDVMKNLLSHYPDLKIIGGNVATEAGAQFLIDSGASAIKVGVGPGSVCSTRVVAGVGIPQLTAIVEASKACRAYNVPLIADGGIRSPGDIAKAIAAGADTVMVGGILAGSNESPGQIVERDGRLFKSYRGMASKGAMARRREIEVKHLNGSSPEPRFEHLTPEGVETLVPYTNEAATDIVNYFIGGLKSAMSYSNALTIEEFQKNAKMIRITNAGLAESHPHALNQ